MGRRTDRGRGGRGTDSMKAWDEWDEGQWDEGLGRGTDSLKAGLSLRAWEIL